MSTREAEVLVSQREGRMCVRFYRRKDGTMLTQNCPVGWKIALRRISRRAGIALSAVMATIPIAAQIQPVTQAQPVEGDTGLDIEVMDVQGAACAGARIDLSKSDRHESITATANDAGIVRLAHLSPGTYELTVTFTGFEPYKRTVTIGRKTILLKTTLQTAATIGVMVEAAQVEVPVIELRRPFLIPCQFRQPAQIGGGFSSAHSANYSIFPAEEPSSTPRYTAFRSSLIPAKADVKLHR